MLKTARQRKIRQLVDEQGQVQVSELNDLLEVSEVTIRRDLEQMAEMGWLQRTHGGAVRMDLGGSEPPIKQRLTEHAAEKRLSPDWQPAW